MRVYKNVLGKNFKKKDEAYKYFRKKVNEFKTSTYTVMTEETPIKQSEMIQLAKDYGSWTNEWFTRKTHSRGIKLWCIIYNTDPFPSMALGFIRNKKENANKFHTELPECVTAKNIFTCFGKGKFNKKQILNGAFRNEIRPQIEEYRAMYKNSHVCAHCKNIFSPDELEVDHLYPFKKIAKKFIELLGEEYLQQCLYKESDGVLYRLQDISPDDEVYPDSPKEAWMDFHKERATYQMLCKNGKNGLPGCHPLKTHPGKRIV